MKNIPITKDRNLIFVYPTINISSFFLLIVFIRLLFLRLHRLPLLPRDVHLLQKVNSAPLVLVGQQEEVIVPEPMAE